MLLFSTCIVSNILVQLTTYEIGTQNLLRLHAKSKLGIDGA